jgi:hypothetical protein
LIHPPEFSGKYQQRHLLAKQGETWLMMAGMKKNFAHCVQQGSMCYPEWTNGEEGRRNKWKENERKIKMSEREK